MEASGKEKAQVLLKIIGVGDQLEVLDKKEKELYNRRLAIGQIADQKQKYADEQTYYPEAPKELISPSDLIKQQQEILARNGENQRKREQVKKYENSVFFLRQSVASMREQLAEEEQKLKEAEENLRIAQTDATELQDESTAELEESIANIEEINRKVRANLDKLNPSARTAPMPAAVPVEIPLEAAAKVSAPAAKAKIDISVDD